MEALQDAYDEYIRQIPRVPYAEPRAIQTVLQIVGESQPAALKARPEQFLDDSFLQKLERSGFIGGLYSR